MASIRPARNPSASLAMLRARCPSIGCLLLVGLLALSGGCASSRGVSLRSTPQNPMAEQLRLTPEGAGRASDRTMQVLRVYNLDQEIGKDPRQLLDRLQAFIDREPTAERVYAFTELAYLEGKRVEAQDQQLALDLYGASVLHAYEYLFDKQLARTRNPYDPQYRGACDLYNGALEHALRIVCREKKLLPGENYTIETATGSWDIACVLRAGAWQAKDISRFEFVSDYEITGLRNHYRMRGLGVPLIAVRRRYEGEPAVAKYYPDDLSFPVTVFLRPMADSDSEIAQQGTRHRGLLELYDPLTAPETTIADRLVPLESDFTTPLAYFLSNPELDVATEGLLHPDRLMKPRSDADDSITGLYMVQPYEPGKIPVLMVHGLWSSPMTWMEMFNDLRSSPEIRDHYQFWFYLYPTGQPFWISATQLRRDLATLRQTLDPYHREPALDQMVLVGHSMGGLVSRLQTIDSKDEFWKLASKQPFQMVKAEPEVREKLQRAFFFQPNPSIRRVITIGTPHRGSNVSNQATQWLLSKLIYLPNNLVQSQQQLFRDNKGMFQETSMLKVHTSIDSLAPDSPIFPVMLSSRPAPWVKYHNIIGLVPYHGWLSSLVKGTDGVVAESSAHLDNAESELIVPADHTTVQSHPSAVLEVRRILLEHLHRLQGRPADRLTSLDVPGVRRVK